jgi:hypothetical protein
MKTLFLTLALSGSLFAIPITIYNTGVNNSGNPLVSPNTPGAPNFHDSHFNVISGPGTANSMATNYIVPYYTETPGTARWIAPAFTVFSGGALPFSSLVQDTGDYVITQTFNVPLASISFATLTGFFAADNCATISLNSSLVAATTGGACSNFLNGSGNFTTLTPFSFSTGDFQPGLNTLRINLRNDGGPSGLYVSFVNAAVEGTDLPEPSTYAAMGGGLLLLALLRRNAYR